MMGFVFRLIPPRHDFRTTMSDQERATMSAHVGYWGELLAQGRVIAFGPVHDRAHPHGIGIVLAEDLAAAEAVRDGDPVMRTLPGFVTEITPMARLVTAAGSFDAPSGGADAPGPG
jgi:uncharacterized protein